MCTFLLREIGQNKQSKGEGKEKTSLNMPCFVDLTLKPCNCFPYYSLHIDKHVK